MISDYYTKMAGMVQAIVDPSVPPSFKAFLMTTMKVGGELLKRIVKDYDVVDVDSLVVGPEAIPNLEQLMQPPPPEGQPPMEGGPPQQGQPGPPEQGGMEMPPGADQLGDMI